MKWRWLVLSWLALAFAGCSDPSDPILGAASAAKDRDQGAYLHHFTPRSRDLLELLWSGSDAHWTNLDVGRIQKHCLRPNGISYNKANNTRQSTAYYAFISNQLSPERTKKWRCKFVRMKQLRIAKNETLTLLTQYDPC